MELAQKNHNFTALKFCVLLAFFYGLQVLLEFDPGFQAYESPSINFFLSFLGHSSMDHLFNNLFFIGLFGTIYEFLTTKKVFIYTFLASAVFANFTAFIFYTESSIIGASGGAMGLLSALAVYRPKKIGLAMGVPVPMWAVLIIYIMINTAGLGVETGTAYEAHLFGLVTGVFIGMWLRNQDDEKKKYGKSDKYDKKEKGLFSEDSEKLNSSKDFEDHEDNLTGEEWERRIRDWEEKYMFQGSKKNIQEDKDA